MNLPNKISLTRIFMIPVFVALFFLGSIAPYNYFISAVLFVVASCTDFIDGYIARKHNLVTNLGKFLDPIADKVVVVIMLFLVIAHRVGLEVFPYNTLVISLCGGLILSRELIVGAFRSIAAKKGLVLAADIYGKVKTVLLDISLAFLIMAGVHEVIGWMGTIVYYAGAVMTVVSGLNYILKNKSVLVDEPKKEEVKEDTEEAKAE